MKKLILLFALLPLTNCLAQQAGSFDNTFNVGAGPQILNFNGYLSSALINSSALLPDGKIMVIGQFKYFDGNSTSKIARLNADGSFDNTFNSAGTGFDSNLPWDSSNYPDKIIAQPDGKILVSGNFSTYNGITKRILIRLNSDGSIDDSFNFYLAPPTLSPEEFRISGILVMENGKILLGHRFNDYSNWTSTYKLLRLNIDGSLDTTFNIENSYDGYIADIKLQTDGKILVAGGFRNISNFWYPRIARLNSDGTVDTTFVIYGGFNFTVTQIEVAPDGSIFAATPASTFDNIPIKRIVKLVPSGYFDFSFSMINPELNFLNGRDFILMQNGQLFVLGVLLTNGVWNYNAGMFNSDGSFDNTFLNVFENNVNGALLQPDGKLVCFGNFNSYDGHVAKRLVRINGPSLATNDFNQIKATVYPNPSSSEIHITGFPENNLIDLIIITDMTGKEIERLTNVNNKINIENLASGMYLLKISSNNKVSNTKFIKK